MGQNIRKKYSKKFGFDEFSANFESSRRRRELFFKGEFVLLNNVRGRIGGGKNGRGKNSPAVNFQSSRQRRELLLSSPHTGIFSLKVNLFYLITRGKALFPKGVTLYFYPGHSVIILALWCDPVIG